MTTSDEAMADLPEAKTSDPAAALVVIREIAAQFQRQNVVLRRMVAGLVCSLLLVLGGAAWYGYHANDQLNEQATQNDTIERVARDTNNVTKDVQTLLESFEVVTGDEA